MIDERAHIVREQAVKADVTESQFFMTAPQLTLPVGAKGYGRVIAPDRMLPEMGERHAAFGQITEESDTAHRFYRSSANITALLRSIPKGLISPHGRSQCFRL